MNLLSAFPNDADIDQVKQILTRILEADNRILKDRDITVRLNELAPSSREFCGSCLEP
ncbi:Small-conductance mechanosensitive channel [Kluyvera cryocrescens]|uniref:Small-conductance mechanosensitive channel n=1 Tax=Kluyvera cryocrescens TaxID=580 RepID=A0A485ASF3_KLUCR|nr:Small-conductance mechanosensitive channel [Kluyvera cryocrescens]